MQLTMDFLLINVERAPRVTKRNSVLMSYLIKFLVMQCVQQFVKTADVNERCNLDDNPCSDSNSYCMKQDICYEGICTCNNGYKYSESNYICFPASTKIGMPCDVDDECIDTSSCDDITKLCSCPSGYAPVPGGTSCYKVRLPLGSVCQGDQCGVNAQCVAFKCQCPSNYVSYDKTNCQGVRYGETCTSGQSCDGRAVCVNNKCQCPSLYLWQTFSTNISSCVIATATLNIQYGYMCVDGRATSDENAWKMCGSGLVCQQCREDRGTTKYKCFRGGSVQQTADVALLGWLLMLLFYAMIQH